jgi:hypothetical protein
MYLEYIPWVRDASQMGQSLLAMRWASSVVKGSRHYSWDFHNKAWEMVSPTTIQGGRKKRKPETYPGGAWSKTFVSLSSLSSFTYSCEADGRGDGYFASMGVRLS